MVTLTFYNKLSICGSPLLQLDPYLSDILVVGNFLVPYHL